MYIIYIVINLVYEIISLFLFLFVNTFFNLRFIPDSLTWKNGKFMPYNIGSAILQVGMLIIEAIILMFIIRNINKQFLIKGNINNVNSITLLTSVIYIGINALIFIVFVCINYIMTIGLYTETKVLMYKISFLRCWIQKRYLASVHNKYETP